MFYSLFPSLVELCQHSVQSLSKDMVDGGTQAKKCKKNPCTAKLVICSKHCGSFLGRNDWKYMACPSANLPASLFITSHQQNLGRCQALHLSCLTNSWWHRRIQSSHVTPAAEQNDERLCAGILFRFGFIHVIFIISPPLVRINK